MASNTCYLSTYKRTLRRHIESRTFEFARLCIFVVGFIKTRHTSALIKKNVNFFKVRKFFIKLNSKIAICKKFTDSRSSKTCKTIW